MFLCFDMKAIEKSSPLLYLLKRFGITFKHPAKFYLFFLRSNLFSSSSGKNIEVLKINKIKVIKENNCDATRIL